MVQQGLTLTLTHWWNLEAEQILVLKFTVTFEALFNVRRSNPSLSFDEACSYAAKQAAYRKNLSSKITSLYRLKDPERQRKHQQVFSIS